VTREPDDEVVVLIRNAYDAFNRREISRATSAMTPDVEWANGWEGGYVHGHDGVRDYWTRQWQQLDPTVNPVAITLADDGRVIVDVDQQVRQSDGTIISAGQVRHIYTLRGGLVARMEIAEPDTA